MSRSLKRVTAALEAAGLAADVLEMTESTRTAGEAAAAAGCGIDQIVKSILFHAPGPDALILFLTAGGNRVDPGRAAEVAGASLQRAPADMVRARTGFAIGGVAPLGHLSPCPVFWDPRLDDFSVVWAAAGTPRHVFAVAPADLRRATQAVPAAFTA